jgi:hypothetical protein
MQEVSVKSAQVESVVSEALFWMKRYRAVDVLVLAYTAWVGALVAVFHRNVREAPWLVAFHLIVFLVVAILPPRGSAWERSPAGEARWKRRARGGLRFFRYTYPLLLVLFFFEEVEHTVHAVWGFSGYWFETYLYAADRWIFGELPSVLLNPFTGLVQDEIVHGFYLSYYFIFVGGAVYAWFGGTRSGHPARGFQTTLTSIMAAFFLCFVWYPFLPGRGPWESPELMAGMTPFRGFVFTPLIERIIQQGSVSGGCFPSSHVGASWGAVFGLSRFHPRVASVLALFALGMSFACVYTRYHHGIDVPAGFLAGLLGAIFAYRFTSERPAEG